MANPDPQTPDHEIFPERLLKGYQSFLSGRFVSEQQRFRELAEAGQKPSVMLIGCCDSRVSPEVIFDARPGEIFVVRNVANLMPPYAPNDDLHGTSAALEFGVMGLRVEHIVVMGHAQCGGIRAYAQNDADPYARPRPFNCRTIVADVEGLREALGGEPLVELIVHDSHTCYLGAREPMHDWGAGCGTCPACELRAKGWNEWVEAGRPALAQ